MKNEFAWTLIAGSLIIGITAGVALDHVVSNQVGQPVAAVVKQSCEWREERSEKRTFNCFSTWDGAYMGQVEEETFGWNANPPKRNENGGVNIDKATTFKDLQTAQKYVVRRVEEL